MSSMRDDKTVEAYVAHDEAEANMLSQVLEAAGIANFVAPDSTGLPLPLSKRGSSIVRVMQTDLDRARSIIEEFMAGQVEESGESEEPEEDLDA